MNGPSISLFGNMTADPEQRYTRNDAIPYARIRVACNRYIGPDKPQEVYYFSANLWHTDAERCMRYCRRGSYIYIQGHYSQEEYTRRDGSPGIDYHVNVREFEHFEWMRGRPEESGEQVSNDADTDDTDNAADAADAANGQTDENIQDHEGDGRAADEGTGTNETPWDEDDGLPVED